MNTPSKSIDVFQVFGTLIHFAALAFFATVAGFFFGASECGTWPPFKWFCIAMGSAQFVGALAAANSTFRIATGRDF